MGSSRKTITGVVHKGLGQLNALYHAGRVLADGAITLFVESDVPESVGGSAPGGRRRESANLGHVGQEFRGGHVGREAFVLGHVSETAAYVDVDVGHLAGHERRAVGGSEKAEEQLDGGALAGAVGTEKSGDTRAYVEADSVERGDAAVSFGEVSRLKQWGHVGDYTGWGGGGAKVGYQIMMGLSEL